MCVFPSELSTRRRPTDNDDEAQRHTLEAVPYFTHGQVCQCTLCGACVCYTHTWAFRRRERHALNRLRLRFSPCRESEIETRCDTKQATSTASPTFRPKRRYLETHTRHANFSACFDTHTQTALPSEQTTKGKGKVSAGSRHKQPRAAQRESTTTTSTLPNGVTPPFVSAVAG